MPKIGLEHVFSMRVDFGVRLPNFGRTPLGEQRAFMPTKSGKIWGPRLNGTVVENSGGDWPHVADDLGVTVDGRYVLQADDGALILFVHQGFRHGPREVLQDVLDGKPIDSTRLYFRTQPSFETPIGPHDWLMRTIIVGAGERMVDHSVFTFYAVT